MRFIKRRAKVMVMVSMTCAAALAAGGWKLYQYRMKASQQVQWDDSSAASWGPEFAKVDVPSSADGSAQPAYFLAAAGKPKPLLISLHTWSGGYTQSDPLAALASKAGWNYVHPHLRGPNVSEDACLSDKVVADVDDAIGYAMQHGAVDVRNVFVVGVSGGGYVALGSYLKTHAPVKAFLSWAPISDLSAWYRESSSRKSRYAADILHCTSDGKTFDQARARQRSPLYWDVKPNPATLLEIYAGIEDGYSGSVPVTHSIQFFNRMASALGAADSQVTQADTIRLLSRSVSAPGARDMAAPSIGGRQVFYRQEVGPVSLTVFQGGHEMLPEYAFHRLQELAGERSPELLQVELRLD